MFSGLQTGNSLLRGVIFRAQSVLIARKCTIHNFNSQWRGNLIHNQSYDSGKLGENVEPYALHTFQLPRPSRMCSVPTFFYSAFWFFCVLCFLFFSFFCYFGVAVALYLMSPLLNPSLTSAAARFLLKDPEAKGLRRRTRTWLSVDRRVAKKNKLSFRSTFLRGILQGSSEGPWQVPRFS